MQLRVTLARYSCVPNGICVKQRSFCLLHHCAYYANSTAIFHPLLEGDLVFKLNLGPSQQGINSTHFGTSF